MRTIWTPEQETHLRQWYGRMPIRDLAAELGHSENATRIRRKRLRILSPHRWTHIFLVTRLADALGIDDKTASRLMKNRLPTHTVYLGNTPAPAVNIKRLQCWLADPANWCYVNVDTITHPCLTSIIRATRRQWNDEWITTGAAARARYAATSTITRAIYNGRLPSATKHGYNWKLLKSEVQQLEIG
jgi:hypothetical protein